VHSPVPHHCLGPRRASAPGHGPEAAPTSTGAYRRMFPGLPALPSDEAFLQTLGTSCGAEVSRLGANGKDDASGAAGWTFLGQFIAHDVTADRSPLVDRADIQALKNVRRQKLSLEFLYGAGRPANPTCTTRTTPPSSSSASTRRARPTTFSAMPTASRSSSIPATTLTC